MSGLEMKGFIGALSSILARITSKDIPLQTSGLAANTANV
jgi:hypothetical protein